MAATGDNEYFQWQDDEGMREVMSLSAEEILARSRLLENEGRMFRQEVTRLQLENKSDRVKIKDNKEKIKLNKQLPWLVGHVVEVRIFTTKNYIKCDISFK